MPKRALLKFRNPDSTKDLNDRFSGLFSKGIFLGGDIVPVPGALRVDVTPFATVGSDGMFVREDSENTRVDVKAGTKNFIVIRQEYITNGNPVIAVESLTETEFNGDGAPGFQGVNNPTLIVFAIVDIPTGATSVNSSNISFLARNEIDIVGRSQFRGSLENISELPPASSNINRENDFYIVKNGPENKPTLFSWDGLNWINITSSEVVLNLLNNHRANSINNEKHLTDIQESALSSTTGIGSEALNFSTIPFPLPLAEVILRYTTQTNTFIFGETVSGSLSGASGKIAFDSTPGIGDGVIALSDTSGNFQNGENIVAGSTVKAVVSGEPLQNRVVSQQDPKVPTQDENDALQGNFEAANGLEPETPSSTNRFVTSSKIFSAPTEIAVTLAPGESRQFIELSSVNGPYFVGLGGQGTANKWFNLYSFDPTEGSEYINSDFFPSKIVRVLTGPAGGTGVNELNPSTSGNVDQVGFFTATPVTSLFLEVDNVVDTSFRVSFGKRVRLGDLLPELLMSRGPEGGQVDASLAQLLRTTPNAVFASDLFESSVQPGEVVAWNGLVFVKANPNMGLTPIGVRGNSNNLIQEGMFVFSVAGNLNTGPLYADKSNPGQLTVTPNEWFIGIAINQNSLLVNMNAIPLQSSGEVVPPVAFPSNFFGSVQPGQTVAYDNVTNRFQIADPDNQNRIPIGIRGNNNNVIQNGIYKATSGNPFTPGVRYFFGRGGNAGSFTTSENDWPLGIAIATDQLFVNATNFPIPSKWEQEHDPDTGHHTFPTGTEVIRNAIVNPREGQIFIRTDTNPPRIDYFNGSAWTEATSNRVDIPSGTRMVFVQDSVPTGWTLDSTFSDRVLMVTNNPAQGAAVGGSWEITGLTGDPHALTIAQIPTHQHDIRGGSGGGDSITYNSNGPRGAVNNNNSLGRPTELAGGGEAHEHGVDSDGNWRPNFINVIVCIKD